MSDAFFEALQNVKIENESIAYEYRLYYDKETGSPLFYSMEDVPGDYLQIDLETYSQSRYDIIVVDNQIKLLQKSGLKKLLPGTEGTPCCVDNVMIVDLSSPLKWSFKTCNKV